MQMAKSQLSKNIVPQLQCNWALDNHRLAGMGLPKTNDLPTMSSHATPSFYLLAVQ